MLERKQRKENIPLLWDTCFVHYEDVSLPRDRLIGLIKAEWLLARQKKIGKDRNSRKESERQESAVRPEEVGSMVLSRGNKPHGKR